VSGDAADCGTPFHEQLALDLLSRQVQQPAHAALTGCREPQAVRREADTPDNFILELMFLNRSFARSLQAVNRHRPLLRRNDNLSAVTSKADPDDGRFEIGNGSDALARRHIADLDSKWLPDRHREPC